MSFAPQNDTNDITDTLNGSLTTWYANVDSALKASECVPGYYEYNHHMERNVLFMRVDPQRLISQQLVLMLSLSITLILMLNLACLLLSQRL